MTDQTINVSAGAAEFCYPRTITAQPRADGLPVDISTDLVKVSLGTYSAPGAWVDPDLTEHPTTSTIVVQTLISAATGLAAGAAYYLWVKVTDSPETVPRRTQGRIYVT